MKLVRQLIDYKVVTNHDDIIGTFQKAPSYGLYRQSIAVLLCSSRKLWVNSLRPEHDRRHCADGNFELFLHRSYFILIKKSLKLLLGVDKKPLLDQVDRRQAITWTNDDIVLRHYMASPVWPSAVEIFPEIKLRFCLYITLPHRNDTLVWNIFFRERQGLGYLAWWIPWCWWPGDIRRHAICHYGIEVNSLGIAYIHIW